MSAENVKITGKVTFTGMGLLSSMQHNHGQILAFVQWAKGQQRGGEPPQDWILAKEAVSFLSCNALVCLVTTGGEVASSSSLLSSPALLRATY